MEKQHNYDGDNILTIGGANTLQLVKKFGSPLCIIDEDSFREKCQTFSDIALEVYPNSQICYTSQAMCCKAIYKILKEYPNMACNVVSGGQILCSKSAKFDSSKIYFNGSNKFHSEIDLALNSGIFNFSVDNAEELDYLEKKSKLSKFKNKINVLIRVNPGIEAYAHNYTKIPKLDSHSGINIEGGEAEKFVLKASQIPTLNFIGLHYHIGSQILEKEPFKQAAKTVLEFVCRLKSKHNVDIKVINVGGGFAAWHNSKDPIIKNEDYKKFINIIAKEIKNTVAKYNLLEPKLIIEPGKSLIAEAGTTLYTVNSVKDVKGIKKYVFVDGEALKPLQCGPNTIQNAVIKCKKENEKPEKVTIAGKCSETSGYIAKDIKLENIEAGDVIALLSTGAYQYSFASNSNRNTIPPVILVKNGNARIIIKGKTHKETLKYDK